MSVALGSALLAAAILLLIPSLTSAQTSNVTPRITAAVNETQLTTLRGNTHPLARAEYDRGPAPSSLPMRRMLLVLKRSPQQEASLDTLIDQQQDQSSPNYHAWLTPQQFGLQFGPADQDIQTITSWLQSHGFTVSRVSYGRTVIEFSGTAGQVRDALHTEIHRYSVNGEDHWANASDPSIPTALTPVVAGVDTLYNFPRHAMHQLGGVVSKAKDTGKVQTTTPLFSLGGTCGVPGVACYGLGPYDFATIYNVLPLWNASPTNDGTGQTIAIVGESEISIQDVHSFRNYFGLPANDPTIIVDGVDPGIVPGDETESDLDVEWAGAVARGATIDFVTSQATEASLGVDLSAQYVVDSNLASILSESYGICEMFMGTAGNLFYSQLWQQAAAEGITVLVATGDSGSAVCDRNAGTDGPAQYGLSVSGFSSTPYNVAVGGTDFFDLTNPATYWSSTNAVPPGAPAGTPATLSALSYIPETTWNNTCTNAVFGNLLSYSTNAEANCNNSNLIDAGFDVPSGASGGKSNCTTYNGTNPTSCTGGYAKPSWQTGTGVPNDQRRDVPDVSLFAANASPSGAFYLVCEADALPSGYSSCDSTNPSTYFLAVGGTSASTPSFAGIMALVNQKTGARQGNANYVLYQLAAQSGASCNSTGTLGANCVFYDTTNGTIAMPCALGSPNCNVATAGDQVGILFANNAAAYNTTTGYDLATGLGSVNATNLASKWSTLQSSLKASTSTLTLNSGNPVNITHGQSVNATIGVAATAPATGTPSGTVALIANTGSGSEQGVQTFTLTSGSASGSTNALPGGTYSVTAHYPGDGVFKASDSSGVNVTVNPEASASTIDLQLFNPTTGSQISANATTAQYGSFELLRMNVTSQAGDACAQNAPGQTGCPTGTLTITNNNVPLDAGTYALNIQGYAEDQTVQLPGGSDVLKVTYPGDSSFTGSNQTQTITITKDPTTTTLGAGANGVFGQQLSITAFINGTGLGAEPTGQVTFFSGSTQLGSSAPIVSGGGGTSTSNPNAVAVTETSQLTLGNNSVTAQYSGDNNYATSTSSPFNIDVQIPTSLSLGSSNLTIMHGASVTFTAAVAASQGGGPGPTGTVTFSDNAGTLGTVPLTGGQTQFTTSALPGGQVQIFANYSGDVNYTVSQNTLTETVTLPATTTTVTASPGTTIYQGQNVTFTAMVTGGSSPTGTVQWSVNSTNSGQPVALSNGQAQFTPALAAGTLTIEAVYGGDTNNSGSSGSLVETVNTAYTVTANPTTIDVSSPGQQGTTTLTFTAQNGFSSGGMVTVTPTCPNLPSETTCSLSSINLPTNGTTTAMLTFTTTAPSAAFPTRRNSPKFDGWRMVTVAAALACLLWTWAMLTGRISRRRRGFTFALLLFAAIAASAGCGGGGGGVTPPTNPGTPTGQYTVSATFTLNGVTQTVSGLTLSVQ